jgi:pimeloyl-ACP methyl ester carboxylesterase
MTRSVSTLLATVLLAACTRTPAEPPPRLSLAPCAVREVAGECGSLPVFENRQTRRGRTIDIRVMVLRAVDAVAASSAVFMFSGGPGTGSTQMAAAGNWWARPLRNSMDIVLVDQRGTGASHPLACPSPALVDPPAVFGHVYDVAHLAACRDSLERGADLTQYTTDAAVADIDDVRAALGYERVSLYGGSYGTRMAQAYARRFPDRVRSMVLDGVAPVDTVLPLGYAASAQQSLDRVMAACAARPDCRTSHPNLAASFATVLSRLDTGPANAAIRMHSGVTVSVPVTRGDFAYAVRGILYDATAVTALPDMIGRAAKTGDLNEFAQRYWNRRVGFDNTLALGQHLSVLCSEDVPFVNEADIAPATDGTFLGRYLVDEYRRACNVWRRGTIAPDARTPVDARVPALLLSGFFDPVTPPEFADRVAQALPMSRTVLAPGSSHGSAGGCPRFAVLHVLERGTLEGMPEVCR